jgi:hypothetical protein
MRKWREKNKESVAAKRRAYWLAHKKEIFAMQKAWKTANPDKVRAYAASSAKRIASTTIKYIRERKDVPCFDCGVRYAYYVMQFDHVSGEKKFNIGTPSGRTMDSVIEEIDKCEVVCANCHMERTWGTRKETA